MELLNTNWSYVYFTCCYFSEIIYPFGFCKECWIKQGKPMAMDGSAEGGSIYE